MVLPVSVSVDLDRSSCVAVVVAAAYSVASCGYHQIEETQQRREL